MGIVGTENSHAEHFVRLVNVEERYPGFRVTALAGGRNERNKHLASQGGIELVVDHASEMVGSIDAGIVCSRDGAVHREQSVPLLRSGIPTFVDKPFAASFDDGRAILDAARAGDAQVTSGSALRFAPEISDFVARRGDLRQLLIVGPGDFSSPYSGLHFYGTHQVEAALEILGNPEVSREDLVIHTAVRGDAITTHFSLGDVDVCLTFLVPYDGGQSNFYATAVGQRETFASILSLGPDYNEPPLQRFLKMLDDGQQPIPESGLLAPISILEAITEAVRHAQGEGA